MTTGLLVGDLIAYRRTQKMPCLCDQRADACELIERQVLAGGAVHERVYCPCGRYFRRVWTHGVGDRSNVR